MQALCGSGGGGGGVGQRCVEGVRGSFIDYFIYARSFILVIWCEVFTLDPKIS